jgi:hypothetical protein
MRKIDYDALGRNLPGFANPSDPRSDPRKLGAGILTLHGTVPRKGILTVSREENDYRHGPPEAASDQVDQVKLNILDMHLIPVLVGSSPQATMINGL